MAADRSGLAQPVHTFGQIQRCLKIAQLAERQRDLDHLLDPGVPLRYRDAIIKRVDDHIFVQRRFSLVHQSNNGGVVVVFYRKHSQSLAPDHTQCNQLIRRGLPGETKGTA